jgi:hypothetical protein
MTGSIALPQAAAPGPTTAILANVALDKNGLKAQKIHAMKDGTLTKNLHEGVRVTEGHGEMTTDFFVRNSG